MQRVPRTGPVSAIMATMRILATALAMAACAMAAEKFGKGLTLDKPIPVATILASPDQYVGKTVQVKGKVTEVCEMMGCWMQQNLQLVFTNPTIGMLDHVQKSR